jgi:formylmethanofuran dehydrogenase subunit B
MPTTHRNVPCTVCGCVCDDLTVVADAGRIARVERACRLAEPWFLAQRADDEPAAAVAGIPAALGAALAEAARVLRAAKSPLIYGLSRSSTSAQRAAVALADELRATIDTTASTGHAPSIVALQQVGESTCTLGEVKQRADLIVFWGSDPETTHPRHIERYCPLRPGRVILVADTAANETAASADGFLKIEPGRDWEALWSLRLFVQGKEPRAGAELGADREELRTLAARMKAAKFGVVFFGAGLTQGPNAHRTVEALLQLVTDLNAYTRFYARRMRRFGDVAGADSVLAWQTGYPFGVNFAAGFPRYNPGEFTGPDMLARGEVDAALVIGADTVADFSEPAAAALRKMPVVVLHSPGERLPFEPAVRIATAVYGVHRPGTAYRLDEVPIPLPVLLESALPGDDEVLEALFRSVAGVGQKPDMLASVDIAT